MESNDELRLIGTLIKHGIDVLSRFRCNKASAAVFRGRLGALAWCFGGEGSGLLALVKQRPTPQFPQQWVGSIDLRSYLAFHKLISIRK